MDSLQRMEQLRIDYKATFGSEHGKRVLWDILANCHVYRSSFVPGKTDTTIFREGERNAGLRIMSMMNIKNQDELQEFAVMEK
jgi:hypothetical protein